MAMGGAAPGENKLIFDIMLAAIVVTILAILIFPIPLWFLDVLIVLSLAASLITAVVSLYIIRPLDFASFPSLLLILTLHRLPGLTGPSARDRSDTSVPRIPPVRGA